MSCVVPFFLDSYALPWGFLSLSPNTEGLSLSLSFFFGIIIIKKKEGWEKTKPLYLERERELMPPKVSKKKYNKTRDTRHLRSHINPNNIYQP